MDAVAAARSLIRSIADWVTQLVRGIPIALGLTGAAAAASGCQAAADGEPHRASASIGMPKDPIATAPHDAGAVVEDAPKPIGQFNITFYYVIGEEEVAPKAVAKAPVPVNDNDTAELAAIVAPETTKLYSKEGCTEIAEVSKEFASQLALQGTGKLHDNRVLNIEGQCNCEHTPCFKVTETAWGTAGSGKALQPFRTVAVDPRVVKLGSLLYVPLLAGRLMPGRAPWGGFIHDGCVEAEDTGGGIDGNQLDLFVGRKAYFLGISGSGGSHAWARHVDVFDGTGLCERHGRQIGRKAASI